MIDQLNSFPLNKAVSLESGYANNQVMTTITDRNDVNSSFQIGAYAGKSGKPAICIPGTEAPTLVWTGALANASTSSLVTYINNFNNASTYNQYFCEKQRVRTVVITAPNRPTTGHGYLGHGISQFSPFSNLDNYNNYEIKGNQEAVFIYECRNYNGYFVGNDIDFSIQGNYPCQASFFDATTYSGAANTFNTRSFTIGGGSTEWDLQQVRYKVRSVVPNCTRIGLRIQPKDDSTLQGSHINKRACYLTITASVNSNSFGFPFGPSGGLTSTYSTNYVHTVEGKVSGFFEGFISNANKNLYCNIPVGQYRGLTLTTFSKSTAIKPMVYGGGTHRTCTLTPTSINVNGTVNDGLNNLSLVYASSTDLGYFGNNTVVTVYIDPSNPFYFNIGYPIVTEVS